MDCSPSIRRVIQDLELNEDWISDPSRMREVGVSLTGQIVNCPDLEVANVDVFADIVAYLPCRYALATVALCGQLSKDFCKQAQTACSARASQSPMADLYLYRLRQVIIKYTISDVFAPERLREVERILNL